MIFFFWKTVPGWVYFGESEDFKFNQVNHRTVRKVQYSLNQAIKNGLNEAILLKWSFIFKTKLCALQVTKI